MTSFLFGGVADRLVPVLQTPVEDIIYEVLDQKGFPTRQEVRDLRNKLDRLEKSLENLTSALEKLKTDVEQAGAAATDALERAGRADARASSPAPAVKADPEVAAAGPKVCKLEDCDTKVRARGFCAKHYQKWKRGTLADFISGDGTTEHEAVRYMVDVAAAGQIVETRYEGDEVIFLLPESGGRVIRVKVDDVRVYDE
jgi:outer membrane murein-binding lipoprotein Lpp